MKLSQDDQFMSMMNSFLITPQGLKAVDEVLAKLSRLEQDSELLSDLLEMLKEEGEHAICLIVTNYEIGQSSYKETVQQAVKKWKEGRK